jgi:hypothetical protein
LISLICGAPVVPTIGSPRMREGRKIGRGFLKTIPLSQASLVTPRPHGHTALPQSTGIVQYLGASSDAARIIDPARSLSAGEAERTRHCFF